MTKSRVRVSDHAVLRYLERAGGFDIEALRQDLAKRCDPAARAGASSIIVDGVALLIADGVVVTALPKRPDEPRLPRRRSEGYL